MWKRHSQSRRLRPLCGSIFAMIASCAITTHSASSQQAATQRASEYTVMECEGMGKCTPWTFYGRTGHAKWSTGEEANLYIVSWNNGQITIDRTDTEPKERAGLITRYTGTIDETTMGSGSYKCPACSKEESMGHWYFLEAGSQAVLPQIAHFCDAVHCLTFRLENGKLVNYTNLMPYPAFEKRVLTFTSFSADSVVIDRADFGAYPLKGHLTGQITGDGFASGTNANGGPWRMSWGARINDIASEDDRGGSPVVQVQSSGAVTPHDWITFLTAVVLAGSN